MHIDFQLIFIIDFAIIIVSPRSPVVRWLLVGKGCSLVFNSVVMIDRFA